MGGIPSKPHKPAPREHSSDCSFKIAGQLIEDGDMPILRSIVKNDVGLRFFFSFLESHCAQSEILLRWENLANCVTFRIHEGHMSSAETTALLRSNSGEHLESAEIKKQTEDLRKLEYVVETSGGRSQIALLYILKHLFMFKNSMEYMEWQNYEQSTDHSRSGSHNENRARHCDRCSSLICMVKASMKAISEMLNTHRYATLISNIFSKLPFGYVLNAFCDDINGEFTVVTTMAVNHSLEECTGFDHNDLIGANCWQKVLSSIDLEAFTRAYEKSPCDTFRSLIQVRKKNRVVQEMLCLRVPFLCRSKEKPIFVADLLVDLSRSDAAEQVQVASYMAALLPSHVTR
jgi:hypothetical protein